MSSLIIIIIKHIESFTMENLLEGVDSMVQAWLKEDIPSFDYGGFVVGNKKEVAILYGISVTTN